MAGSRPTRCVALASCMAIGAVVVLAPGCATAPRPAVGDARLVGMWRTAGGDATLTLTETGLYTLAVKDLARPVIGSYDWSEKTGMLVLQTRRESAVCGDDQATYRVILSAETLDARVERDACTIRERLLAQPLKRVTAPR